MIEVLDEHLSTSRPHRIFAGPVQGAIMSAGHPTTEPKHYDYLDALRGWAIIGVVISHSVLFFPDNAYWIYFWTMGTHGVRLFFLVSSFTLFASMSVRREPTRNFFVRRFFRIAPMFYLAMLIHAWLLIFASDYPLVRLYTFHLDAKIAGLFFAHGIRQIWLNDATFAGWSLGVEACFYVVLPVVFPYINNLKRAVVVLVLSLVLCPLLCMLLGKYANLFAVPPSVKCRPSPWGPSHFICFRSSRKSNRRDFRYFFLYWAI